MRGRENMFPWMTRGSGETHLRWTGGKRERIEPARFTCNSLQCALVCRRRAGIGNANEYEIVGTKWTSVFTISLGE